MVVDLAPTGARRVQQGHLRLGADADERGHVLGVLLGRHGVQRVTGHVRHERQDGVLRV